MFVHSSLELEAAEALAQLSAAATESVGNRGKCPGKGVKAECPPLDSGLNSVAQSVAMEMDQSSKTVAINATKNLLVAEHSKLSTAVPTCADANFPVGGGRLRNNLTEAEKEARRMRRILANRESARQTIRRRQALCEALNRKSADLEQENKRLKKEKKLAIEEYKSLETVNKNLKAMIARAVKTKVNESPKRTNSSLLLHNRIPLMHLWWPSVIQSSDPSHLQQGYQNPIVFPSNIALSSCGRLSTSQEQQNSTSFNLPTTSLYVVPCPWFFPLPDDGDRNAQDETSVTDHYSASSSSKIIAQANDLNSCFPVKVKMEASSSPVAKTTDLNEKPVGFQLEEYIQHIGPKSEEKFDSFMPMKALQTKYADFDNGVQSDFGTKLDGNATKASPIVSGIEERNQAVVNHSSTRLTNAVVAAEARKRRKELKKLKNSHGKHCVTHL